MGSENSIGYLESEALIAVMRDQDVRDMQRPALSLFQRRAHRGAKLTVRRFNRRPGQLRHTTIGGDSVPVREGAWSEAYYEPSFLKVHKDLNAEDVALFTDADTSQPRSEVMEDANARIADLATYLREDNAEERNRMCLGALRDALTYRPKGQSSDVSVSYSLNALTAPSTAWNTAGALIPSDMMGWIKDYRDNNTKGLPPTHVFYNPDLYNTAFQGNTEWAAYKQANPGLAQGFLGIAGGTREADNLGVLDPLWGLTWVPITGSYVDLADVTQDRWPVSKLSFARIEDNGQSMFEWGMLRDPFHNPQADYNVELLTPQHGRAVKVARATLFDNGLPVIKDPQMVQHVTVYP